MQRQLASLRDEARVSQKELHSASSDGGDNGDDAGRGGSQAAAAKAESPVASGGGDGGNAALLAAIRKRNPKKASPGGEGAGASSSSSSSSSSIAVALLREYAGAVGATLQAAAPQVDDAARAVEEMRAACVRLAEFFGEPRATPSEKVFAALRQFIVSFNASKAKVMRQRQSQARQQAANGGGGPGGPGAASSSSSSPTRKANEAKDRFERRRSAINGTPGEEASSDDDSDGAISD